MTCRRRGRRARLPWAPLCRNLSDRQLRLASFRLISACFIFGLFSGLPSSPIMTRAMARAPPSPSVTTVYSLLIGLLLRVASWSFQHLSCLNHPCHDTRIPTPDAWVVVAALPFLYMYTMSFLLASPLQCSPSAAPAHLAFGNFCMAFRLRYHSGTHWPFIVPLDFSLFLVIALVLRWKSLLFAFFQKQAAFVSDWTFLHLGWAQLVAQRSLLFVGRGAAASMIVLLVTLTNHTMTRAPNRAACMPSP
jgi:hypothetical protein